MNYSCSVHEDGGLYCWGRADFGCLGNGHTEGEFPTPVAVLEPGGGDPVKDWAQVATGVEHTCGLKKDGRLFCWGTVYDGKVGNGETEGYVAVPQAVLEPGGADPDDDWARIAVGYKHSCGLKKNGRLYCWGYGVAGRLGNDGEDEVVPVPAAVLEPGGEPAANDWARVSAGTAHTCALKQSGRLFCWGSGDGGALGNGALDTVLTPVEVVEAGGEPPAGGWARVSAGPQSTCAVKLDGHLFCWGTANYGELGNALPPGEFRSTTPIGVLEPGEGDPSDGWADVSAGNDHTCGLKQDGRLFCWGSAESGRLGNDETGGTFTRPEAVLEPLAQPASNDWGQVASGWEHTCALEKSGTPFCWGDGDSGRLGNDETEGGFSAPVPVAAPVP